MNDSIFPNNKNNKKAAIISLTLGIIDLILFNTIFWSGLFLNWFRHYILLLIFFSASFVAIVGFFFGREGEKSTFEGIATIGVALCILSFICWFLLAGWCILVLCWANI
jgi:hypothetical protein